LIHMGLSRIARGFLICLLMPILVSCSLRKEETVWYAVDASYGFMMALTSQKDRLVVVAIPMAIVDIYRQRLSAQGIVSDNLGAVQDLFGIRANHYLKGTEEDFQAVGMLLDSFNSHLDHDAQQSVEMERLNSLVLNAAVLSKTPMLDTLGKLAGPRTESADIALALKKLAHSQPEIWYFDMGVFLDASLPNIDLKKWIMDWTSQALRVTSE